MTRTWCRVLGILLVACLGVLGAACWPGSALAGPLPAWQTLGGSPDGAIGLMGSQQDDTPTAPAIVVHDRERYVAVVEQAGLLVVYRQFRTGYGTTQAWMREGGTLNRSAGAQAINPTLLSTGRGELYVAWTEVVRGRDIPASTYVARMRRDERSRVRWEAVGSPIVTGDDPPRLVELNDRPWLIVEDRQARARAAQWTGARWEVAPTPITPPGLFGDVVVYGGALYIVNRIGPGYRPNAVTIARATPTPTGDVRVENLGQVGRASYMDETRLAAGTPALGDGRPLVASLLGDNLVVWQLTADERAFAPLDLISPPSGQAFSGRPLLAALGDEVLLGIRAGNTLSIERLGATPTLPVRGHADLPADTHVRPQLVVDAQARVALLTFRGADERPGALGLGLSP